MKRPPHETALGPHHPDTTTALNTLTATYHDLGRAEEALPLEHQAQDHRGNP